MFLYVLSGRLVISHSAEMRNPVHKYSERQVVYTGFRISAE